MEAKIPWEGLPASEADVSATVATNVLFETLGQTNVGDCVLVLIGVETQLSICVDRWDNIGMLTPEQFEQFDSILEQIGDLRRTFTMEQNQ